MKDFWLYELNVSTGMSFTSEQKMNLIDFISKVLNQSKNYDIPRDSDLTNHFLHFGNLTLTLEGIQCMIKERRSGWLNGEMRDIFIDSINLHNGFSSSKLPP